LAHEVLPNRLVVFDYRNPIVLCHVLRLAQLEEAKRFIKK
jgi:hypothetical protein